MNRTEQKGELPSYNGKMSAVEEGVVQRLRSEGWYCQCSQLSLFIILFVIIMILNFERFDFDLLRVLRKNILFCQ